MVLLKHIHLPYHILAVQPPHRSSRHPRTLQLCLLACAMPPSPPLKCPSPFFPSKLLLVLPSSSHGTKPKSPLDSLSILLVFAALGDHFPCSNAISCICLSSLPDSESLESKCYAHLFSIVPDQQVLHKCLLTDRMHEVSVLSAVSKDLYVTVYPQITQCTLFPLCLY